MILCFVEVRVLFLDEHFFDFQDVEPVEIVLFVVGEGMLVNKIIFFYVVGIELFADENYLGVVDYGYSIDRCNLKSRLGYLVKVTEE